MIQIEGELFEVVQRAGIFQDSKTFVDAVPRIDQEEILQEFQQESPQPNFSLQEFIEKHFILPGFIAEDLAGIDASSSKTYINSLWDFLLRQPEVAQKHDSLIPLQHTYIVPGGRFREIYYWDSYFTAVGLTTVNRFDLIESMIKNFIYLLNKLGLVPNGNRKYYVSRSQPPVLTYMVDLLYQQYGIDYIKPYLSALEKEYKFWMEQRAVEMPDGEILNRYFSDIAEPRPESFIEDVNLAAGLDDVAAKKMYQDIRAAAESGWDFSSRWFVDPMDFKTIQTTDIVPVDLNGLLFGIENLLAKYFSEVNDVAKAKYYLSFAKQRKQSMQKYFWDEEKGFYFDYNLKSQTRSNSYALSGVVPLFVNLASMQQAKTVVCVLQSKFLQPGGLVTTLIESGQQWDAPNGWPPLQWFAVKGLLNYNLQELALEIARRWLTILNKEFAKTKVLREKYNVCNHDILASGGEYSVQQGPEPKNIFQRL
jgi:alpha,alpha-trehalase